MMINYEKWYTVRKVILELWVLIILYSTEDYAWKHCIIFNDNFTDYTSQ